MIRLDELHNKTSIGIVYISIIQKYMKRTIALVLLVFTSFSISAQEPGKPHIPSNRKNVRTSTDIMAGVTPVACAVAVLALKDWDGLKQGAFAAATTLGVSYGLKYLVGKERPDDSNARSFPSLHTSISFTGAAFIQKRYGWKWGIPAYAVASYVGWGRVYAKKHDWWDVAAGAAIGIGSAYIYTRPFAKDYNISVSPVAGNGHFGFYASMTF